MEAARTSKCDIVFVSMFISQPMSGHVMETHCMKSGRRFGDKLPIEEVVLRAHTEKGKKKGLGTAHWKKISPD